MNSIRIGVMAVVIGAATACCSGPARNAERSTPDSECRTGSVHGYSIAIWSCLNGERVVAWNVEMEMVCKGTFVERGPCDQPTPFEVSADAETRESCPALLGRP